MGKFIGNKTRVRYSIIWSSRPLNETFNDRLAISSLFEWHLKNEADRIPREKGSKDENEGSPFDYRGEQRVIHLIMKSDDTQRAVHGEKRKGRCSPVTEPSKGFSKRGKARSKFHPAVRGAEFSSRQMNFEGPAGLACATRTNLAPAIRRFSLVQRAIHEDA